MVTHSRTNEVSLNRLLTLLSVGGLEWLASVVIHGTLTTIGI